MGKTEQKILEAALRMFAREGYDGATTRRIAEEAGVSEMTLFRKFQYLIRSSLWIKKLMIFKRAFAA
ncbi:MAG: helix-turn-helix transcriptional regulator [Candidatus Methanoperedens sp.]|nr:helix-turn-helix transcriptional regulator [Candidatus Methanoperedens sp.]